MTLSDPISRPVDLADEPEFQLGSMTVRPSLGLAEVYGESQRVEPRVMEVLIVLVRAAGATVTRDTLIDACWGGRAVSDDAIARIIAKVRALSRGMHPAPFVLHTVSKVGFRLEAGEVPADEAPPTPTGQLDDENAPARQWRVAGIVGISVIVVAGIPAWMFFGSPGRNSAPIVNGRVEVEAFETGAGDPVLDSLAPSMTEALLQTLTQSGILAGAAPRTDQTEAAEFRLTGVLTHTGDAVSARVRLLERASGLVLWSAERAQTQGPARLARDLARQVTASLRCALDHRGASRATMAADVFGLFLSACDASLFLPTAAGALGVSRRLARAAPDVAGAHALHGILAAWVANETNAGDQVAALRREADDAARRALALDPRSAEAYAALAANEGLGRNFAARERFLQQALALDPNVWPAERLAASLLFETGRFDEGVELARRIVASGDPSDDGVIYDLALRLAANGDAVEASTIIERAGSLADEELVKVHWAIAFWWSGLDAARAAPVPQDGGTDQTECFATYLARLAAAGGAGMRGLPESCARVQADWRVRMLAREGDIDGAYAAMDALPDSLSVRYFLFYPEMKAFRADPRFMKLAAGLGLVDYWRDSGHWPDFCAAPDLSYDCKAAAEALR